MLLHTNERQMPQDDKAFYIAITPLDVYLITAQSSHLPR